MNKTLRLVEKLKENGEDFEFYPTTTEIITIVKNDITEENNSEDFLSILDCGAGDGRVLNALTKGKKYAIEKARPLLNALDKNIFVVGTDFESQTLIDKRCDIVFSNPPYSCYDKWAVKIIKEANAAYIYLVLPERWAENQFINEALKLREAKTTILGSFDFIEADRMARAKVDIIRIKIRYERSFSGSTPKIDPFDIWFNEYFKLEVSNDSVSKYELDRSKGNSLKEKLKNELVSGSDLVSILESLYEKELAQLIKIYQSLGEIDPDILNELDVNISGVKEALSQKIENLKDRYWNELFNNLKTITNKLTAKSRKSLLSTLTAHTHVDFTSSNVRAVVIWAIKNANTYFDEQLIYTVEMMTEKANIQLYKSNKRTFGDEAWMYTRMPDELDRYKLDYRVVLQRIGGIETDSFYNQSSRNGLTSRASDFIDDLCTIASNLGFDTEGLQRTCFYQWESNAGKEFEYRDSLHGKTELLFFIRAFRNGNLHVKFNPKFICRLNVEFGRLKGWLKSPKEAAEELDIEVGAASNSFDSNIKLESDKILALGFKEVA